MSELLSIALFVASVMIYALKAGRNTWWFAATLTVLGLFVILNITLYASNYFTGDGINDAVLYTLTNSLTGAGVGKYILPGVGLVVAGCNVVIFSTGLGTPTGNPIVPVLKVSTNSALAKKMPDIIDYDCGPIIEGTPLADIADGLFEKIIATASGTWRTKADALEQYDFMLWKRSLEL